MRENIPSPTLIENTIWVVSKSIGFAQYDFDFESVFICKHPYNLDGFDGEISAIARIGSAPNYEERYEEMLSWGIRLINSPKQYQKSSLLPVETLTKLETNIMCHLD